jgi:hypothetical protein
LGLRNGRFKPLIAGNSFATNLETANNALHKQHQNANTRPCKHVGLDTRGQKPQIFHQIFNMCICTWSVANKDQQKKNPIVFDATQGLNQNAKIELSSLNSALLWKGRV